MQFVQMCLSFFGNGAVMRRSRDEAKALLNAGHSVIVITDLKYTHFINEFKEHKDKLRVVPIKLHYLPYRFRKVSSELIYAFQSYRALNRLSKRESIDLIICHGVSNCYTVARFANKNKIANVLILHELIRDRIAFGNPYNWWTTQFYKHATRYALNKIQNFAGVSSYMKKLAILDGAKPQNTFVKHNPVDTEIFYPFENIEKDIDILFIGRLSIEKGVSVLIDATRFFSKNWKLTIIGDGALRRELELQSKTVNYDIKFEGWIIQESLRQYIRRTKVVVVPSVTEPHGIVVLEAMACGVPVIGSRVGGIPDMIKHKENGWLVKPNDAENLGKIINEVLLNENRLEEVGVKALNTANKFSKKQFNKKIVKFYEFLIEQNKKFKV